MEKRIGKIQAVRFGIGGYQDAMIGITVTLGSDKDSWKVGSGKWAWDANIIDCSKYSQWTEEDRSEQYDQIMRYVSDLLAAAKVKDVYELKGVPVEATFDGDELKEWRILEEVL